MIIDTGEPDVPHVFDSSGLDDDFSDAVSDDIEAQGFRAEQDLGGPSGGH